MGKGLGNRFLDDLRHADALVHVVDVSGTTDAEGKFLVNLYNLLVAEGANDRNWWEVDTDPLCRQGDERV